MKYKTLFRLMLKLMGIYFLAIGGLAIVGALASFLYQRSVSGMLATGGPTWPELLNLLANALYAAVGLYLFFGGKWIVDKAIPSNRPYCHECGYELTAATQNRCPECGTPFRLEDVMPKDIPDEIASLTTPADATGQRTSEGERLTSPEPTTDH